MEGVFFSSLCVVIVSTVVEEYKHTSAVDLYSNKMIALG
jgi:hypothetical protein